MDIRPSILCVFLLAPSLLVRADGNLIFNSGFEMGDAGTGFVKVLQLDTNPSQIYEGPVCDSSTFSSGGTSLRIPNRFAERCELFFKEFKLKPGVEYTFSASMKGSVEKLPVFVTISSATVGSGWDVRMQSFKAGTGWGRQAFKFTTKTPWPNEWYLLRISVGKDKGSIPGDLWLDDVQIVEGESSSYGSSPLLEAAASAERSYYIVDGKDENAKAVLKLHNYANSTTDAGLQVSVIEDSVGGKVFSKGFTVSLGAGEAREIPFELPLSRFGAYRLETELVSGGIPFASHPGFVAVAGLYVRTPIDIGKSFCVGLNMIGSANYQDNPRVVEKPGYWCDGRSTDAYMRLLSDMGCRLVRDWGNGSFRWRDCEEREGVFNNVGIDRTLDIYTRHGMHVMPVLGAGDFLLSNRDVKKVKAKNLPDWLLGKCPTVERIGDWKQDALLPPMDLWRAYIRNVVGRCSGKVGYYEVINEPNGYLGPGIYMDYLKAASEEIRKADDGANVVGFCATSDMGGRMLSFFEPCFKADGLKYADIISFHPYMNAQLNSIQSADKAIDAIRELSSKYSGRRDVPIWNTELLYLHGDDVNYIESGKHAPYEVAWRFLTDLDEGVAQECFLEQSQIFRNTLSPHFACGYQSQVAPSGDFVVFNALARYFEGAKAVDKIRWGNDTICYIYEREGRRIAAFWNYGDMKNLKLDLGEKVSGLTLLDLFGNEIPFPADGVLKLGMEPSYLTVKRNGAFNIFASEMSAKNFDGILRDGRVKAECPLEIGAVARLVPENEGWTLVVSFRNCSGQELSGRVGVQGEGVVSLSGVDFKIPANAELALPVPVKLKAEWPTEVFAKFALDGRILSLPLRIAPQGRVLRSGARIQMETASMEVSSDEKTLKLSFAVKDATPSGTANGREPWEQDCIELFIDADPRANPVRYPETYTEKVARIFVMPHAPEGRRLLVKSASVDLRDVKAYCAANGDGYVAVVDIPLSSFDGGCIGFDVQIDDADAIKRHGVLNWNSRGEAFRNRLEFGFLVFK